MDDISHIGRTTDLRVLLNALDEVLTGPHAIVAWEFRARMGVDRHYALDLRRRILEEFEGDDPSTSRPGPQA